MERTANTQRGCLICRLIFLAHILAELIAFGSYAIILIVHVLSIHSEENDFDSHWQQLSWIRTIWIENLILSVRVYSGYRFCYRSLAIITENEIVQQVGKLNLMAIFCIKFWLIQSFEEVSIRFWGKLEAKFNFFKFWWSFLIQSTRNCLRIYLRSTQTDLKSFLGWSPCKFSQFFADFVPKSEIKVVFVTFQVSNA